MTLSLLNIVLACFAWAFVVAVLVTVASAIQRSSRIARRMHAIPCTRCRYFTGEMLLKCPVNPKAALTEQAIDCPDFVGEPF
jgi:hypothetical protein